VLFGAAHLTARFRSGRPSGVLRRGGVVRVGVISGARFVRSLPHGCGNGLKSAFA
jgi:hypothetical protein